MEFVKKELVVPQRIQWIEYIESCSDRGCSGINDCDECQKRMYASRTKYVKSWISVYVSNRREIREGRARIEKLLWKRANMAKEFNLGDFHREKCNTDQDVAICNCETASLFRAMCYDPVADNATMYSLDRIYPIFLENMKHQTK